MTKSSFIQKKISKENENGRTETNQHECSADEHAGDHQSDRGGIGIHDAAADREHRGDLDGVRGTQGNGILRTAPVVQRANTKWNGYDNLQRPAQKGRDSD